MSQLEPHSYLHQKQLPLISGNLERVIAYMRNKPVSAKQLLADAVKFSECLPNITLEEKHDLNTRGFAINLCNNRYWFMVAFLAVCLKSHSNCLPQNHAPKNLQTLLEQYPDAYIICDTDLQNLQLEDLPQQGYKSFRPDLHLTNSTGTGTSTSTSTSTSTDTGISNNIGACANAYDKTSITVAAKHTAAIVFTSGSTGTPKPNAKTFANLHAIADLETPVLATPAVNDINGTNEIVANIDAITSTSNHVVATVPAQHMYGLESAISVALFGNVVIHSNKAFYPADIALALNAMPAPRTLVTTPMHLRVLLKSNTQLPSISKIVSATAPLNIELAREAETKLGCTVVEIFGFSEAGAIAYKNTTSENNWRLFKGLNIHIQKTSPQKTSHQKLSNQAFVQGHHLSQPQPFDDVVTVVNDKEFSLLGRSQDRVNIAGKRASLAHLNEILLSIAEVSDGIIFLPPTQSEQDNQPHSKKTNQPSSTGATQSSNTTVSNNTTHEPRLAAFVIANNLSAKQLVHKLQQRIDPVFIPRPIMFVSQLPRNATGKIERATIIKLLQVRQAKHNYE